ncbi:alpha/beta hydrolase [Phenylobacterium sp.]|uniref:alpha/beta hydrolase n=1 Tax=Phenylobacterium sp. TaxID=1871053 RepID=UPI0025E4778B|nr:alpha/beta hydrolase [Phenylobacterium sp.]
MDDAGQIQTPRAVAAKSLRTPTTVSPQLQRSISTMAAQAAAGGGGLPLGWRPGSADEWTALIAQVDAQALALVPALAAMFPHRVELMQVAGVTVRQIVPASLDPAKAGRVLLNFHGGGYVLNGGEASTGEAVLGAHYSRMTVVSVDYRMPPEHPFPAAVDDAVAVWRALAAERPAGAIGVFGTSAGGGLTLALALKLKELGLELPGALATGTPWTDLTGASDSYQVNAGVDGVFSSFDGMAGGMAALYAGDAGVTHPLVSPIYGDFAGFPPTIFTTGTRDLLLSDTVRAYRAMRAAGVTARLEVHEAMSHAEYIYAFDSPESAVVFRDIAAFFDEHLKG